jgi:hypothetical protein
MEGLLGCANLEGLGYGLGNILKYIYMIFFLKKKKKLMQGLPQHKFALALKSYHEHLPKLAISFQTSFVSIFY